MNVARKMFLAVTDGGFRACLVIHQLYEVLGSAEHLFPHSNFFDCSSLRSADSTELIVFRSTSPAPVAELWSGGTPNRLLVLATIYPTSILSYEL